MAEKARAGDREGPRGFAVRKRQWKMQDAQNSDQEKNRIHWLYRSQDSFIFQLHLIFSQEKARMKASSFSHYYFDLNCLSVELSFRRTVGADVETVTFLWFAQRRSA